CRFRPSAPARAAAWRTASAAADGGCFCRWGIAAPADTRWTRPTWPGLPRSDTLRSTWTAATEPQADHPPPASGRYESIDSGSCTDPRHRPPPGASLIVSALGRVRGPGAWRMYVFPCARALVRGGY